MMRKLIFAIGAVFLLMASKAFPQTGYAVIQGKIDLLTDSVVANLFISQYGDPDFADFNTQCPVKNHSFYFRVNTSAHPEVFSLMFKINTLNTQLINQYRDISINYGLLKSGDSITVSIVNHRLIFSGKGAEKLQVLEQFQHIHEALSGHVSFVDTGLTKVYFNSRDSVARKELNYL